MSVNLKLLDHIQLSSRVHTNFACEYSEDGKIFLLLENGVGILTLKGCMENIFPRFSFRKDLITLSNTSLCENIDVDLPSFINDLNKQSFYESVLDVGLSGNTLNATTVTSRPVCAMWSPRGIVEKTEGALTVLTSLHNIEIYVEIIDENEISSFIRVANFSKDIADYYRRSWKKIDTFTQENKFCELKRRVDLVTPTAFTWSHVILKDRKAFCILFVGHRDGSITAWRFVERKASEVYESRLQFLERYNTKLKEITSLHWFCRKSDDKIKFSDEVVFSTESDLKVDKITIMNYQNITYMITVKQNYLQIYAINGYGEVFEGKQIQVGNIYITGSSCIPYHIDSRCAISLMPIYITPGYKCPFCKCVVSKEMDREYYPIFCPYCDVPMKRRCFDKKYKKITEDTLETINPDEVVISECNNDCLKDEIHFSDIEENTVDYIVLTDSEDERDESVKELYSRIKNIVLSSPSYEIEPIIPSTAGGSGHQPDTSPKSTQDQGEHPDENDGDDEEDDEDEYDNDDAYVNE
ncbi:TFIIIC delta domain containing protein [Asbolus verrucosus]|uniref:TFIIIC delta domain containing protein n=1 Tax=Asbolus verrucosus TaxID=1661398 RepID=A0A482VW66_ASBVE|nr:TFIIIC delta domain containing protein [Asbolus verrucosus]